MATNQNNKTATKEEVKKPIANGKPKFYLNDLREHSQELFGVKPEVLDGAFLNVKETQITKDEADKMIKDFLKKEVK